MSDGAGADVQARVDALLEEFVESGAESGLQVAVHRGGEPVVDACAGMADASDGRPLRPDTLIHSFSLGKGFTATLVHGLAERGLLDYDTRSPITGPSSAPTARNAPRYATR
ncbi:serine hydrolase [Streptomyces sp. NPDC058466]|uniref:serine hydrolase n=1 Tax=Streptomyces sp. NPDC058466 TaxID=3346512 RepID=UPI003662F935